MPAPSFTVLLDWVEGRLDPAHAEAVASYLETADPRTLETVSWVRAFLADARSMPLEAPPPELSARLRSMFLEMHVPGRPDQWSEASLLYDTRSVTAAAGVRSIGEEDGLHLAFDSALGRFVIEVVPADHDQVHVQGLIIAESSATGIDLAFLEGGTLRRAARASADGRFEVSAVPVEVDELWLTGGDLRVRAALDLRRS